MSKVSKLYSLFLKWRKSENKSIPSKKEKSYSSKLLPRLDGNHKKERTDLESKIYNEVLEDYDIFENKEIILSNFDNIRSVKTQKEISHLYKPQLDKYGEWFFTMLYDDCKNQFAGVVSNIQKDEYKLNAFSYINPLNNNSNAADIALVKKTGIFGQLSIDGKYPVAAIPRIISEISTLTELHPKTNKDTFFRYRTGRGCQNTIAPVRLLKRQLVRFNSKEYQSLL